jgi:SAM-dependent methyltransferase
MRLENVERLDTIKLSKLNPNYLHYKYLFRDLLSSIELHAKGKILDIGCGNKPYKNFFKNYESYIGCDIIQSSKNEVDVICNATSIPLENEQFDTVFSTQTIEHVFEHDQMLNEAFRLLKNGGKIIVSGPMNWRHHEEPYDFFRFTKYGLQGVLEKAGFEVLEIKPNGGKWPLWGLMTIQTLPSFIVNLKIFKFTINSLCDYLDSKDIETKNTINFVAVARKLVS